VWWIGPLLGAAVAAGIHRLALEERAEPEVTPATPEGWARSNGASPGRERPVSGRTRLSWGLRRR
jgi:hypothetical protein